MKIGIYDPYLHILGGAERYVLSIAACFPDAETLVFAPEKEWLNRARKKFGLELKQNITVESWPNSRSARRVKLAGLDYFFYVTDGSLFYSPAKKNILIIQSPAHIPSRNLLNMIKLWSWQKIICYSRFMEKIIQERLDKSAVALFVPINKYTRSPANKKDNLIVSVGRFFSHLHKKKQLEIVQIFKELVAQGLSGTRLLLIGSVDPGGEGYLKIVKDAIREAPIELLTNTDFVALSRFYSRAKIYWHAAGFGEDLVKYPERAEHFGVSTVEAMAHGAVPVVFAGGGQLEIVKNGKNGFTWRSNTELIKYTRELLRNEDLRIKLADNARKTADDYTQVKFCEKLHEILET